MTAQVIVLPSGHTFGVEPHETVLEAALRQGIGLPYGCRDGACGACKGRILEGKVRQNGVQKRVMSDAERADGLALFCCTHPQGNITIEVHGITRGNDAPIKTLPCRVEKIEKIHDVAVLTLKLPESSKFQFRAGQYIDILMQNGKQRSFSIANAPHDDACLELHIRHQPGGSFSDYVFTQMKERELMRFRGPFGSFCLRENSEKPILFVASGTGFAPVKSIIEHAIHKDIARDMVLYWGGRTKDDLYMAELALSWQRKHANITFIPVLSEMFSTEEWVGRSGLVHEAVLEDFDNLLGYQVYACGAPIMVEAAHRSFTHKHGLPEEEFFSDAFFLSKDMGKSQ